MLRDDLPDLQLFFTVLKETNDKELAFEKVRRGILRKQEEVLSREYPLKEEEYEKMYEELIKLQDKCEKIEKLERKK